MWYIIGVLIWLIGAVLTYSLFVKKWNKGLVAKLYYSAIWPLLIPLYIIHYIYNKLIAEEDKA